MKKLIFALIAAATAMSAAHAQTGYVGLGITSVDHNYNVAGATNGSADGYKASGKIFGGIDIDKMWGVEAGYTDFRSSSFNYTLGGSSAHVESDGHAFYLAGKATAALNDQFGVFGKLGIAQTKSTLSGSLSRSDSDTSGYGAIGAQYNLSKQVALSLEYERYGKSRDFGAKPDAWTVAARYNF
ncbi:MAG: outer membrane beta-barrel protein [Pseudomonadota bacterium]